jgi:DNA-binding LytR/AlgR family response regulator
MNTPVRTQTTKHREMGRLCVLAVDDEPPALEELVHLLRADPRIAKVDGVTDGTKALRYVHKALDSGASLDAVFLDLRMPGLNGLDLARVLTRFAHPPAIVFVTAYDNHAVEAFDLKAVDYVLKPVRPERLADAVDRIIHVLGREVVVEEAEKEVAAYPQPVELLGDPNGESIPVELGGVTRFIPLADVQYVEAQGDYARLYTASGNFLLRMSLSTLEESWSAAGFVRIHRSHLVALRHIEELRLEGGQMTVRVGTSTLTVSRRHARQVRDLLVRNAKPNASSARMP